jgi:hypothetical protein
MWHARSLFADFTTLGPVGSRWPCHREHRCLRFHFRLNDVIACLIGLCLFPQMLKLFVSGTPHLAVVSENFADIRQGCFLSVRRWN